MWRDDYNDESLGLYDGEDKIFKNIEQKYPDEAENAFETYVMATIMINKENIDIEALISYYLASRFYHDFLNAKETLEILKRRFGVKDLDISTFPQFIKWSDFAGPGCREFHSCGKCLTRAIKSNNINMVEYFLSDIECNYYVIVDAAIAAASLGRTTILKIILDYLEPIDFGLMKLLTIAAAKKGNIDPLLLLNEIDQGLMIDSDVIDAAITGGNLEILKLVHIPGIKYNYMELEKAVRRGNKDMVRFVINKLSPSENLERQDSYLMLKTANDEILPMLVNLYRVRDPAALSEFIQTAIDVEDPDFADALINA